MKKSHRIKTTNRQAAPSTEGAKFKGAFAIRIEMDKASGTVALVAATTQEFDPGIAIAPVWIEGQIFPPNIAVFYDSTGENTLSNFVVAEEGYQANATFTSTAGAVDFLILPANPVMTGKGGLLCGGGHVTV